MFVRKKATRGFTLIELLIVVAIITILALIAVPNFLEAQTRSKASRVKAEFRTLATALEAYFTDNNAYPYGVFSPPQQKGPASLENYVPLTTPVAYLTHLPINEPFTPDSGFLQPDGTWVPRPWGHDYYFYWRLDGPFVKFFNLPQTKSAWLLRSVGVDRRAEGKLIDAVCNSAVTGEFVTPEGWQGVNMIYDPSNGTVSRGDIARVGGQVPGCVSVAIGKN